MRWPIRLSLVVILLGWPGATSRAHFNMLLPEALSVKRGEEVTLLYQWGHPFEHQLFDAPKPERAVVLTPDHQQIDLRGHLEKTTIATGADKEVTAYRMRFIPKHRGDYAVLLQTPPIWMEEEQEFLQDTVKVVVHVQAQKGWEGAIGQTFEMVPLTRPYGLQAGMVFQALARVDEATSAQPATGAGALVEIERYNPTPPKELPPDEHITRTVHTDPQGVATCTLTDPGWWSITAHRDGGLRRHNGKDYPVRRRATLWVFVEEKVALPPLR
jgi:cobalt/nickel transport protein